MKIKHLLAVLIAFAVSCSKNDEITVEPPNSIDIPIVYQNLYDEIQTNLTEADNTISALWNGLKHCSDYSIDNRFANTTTLKTNLLNTANVQKAYQVIDAYETAGIKAVRLHAGYPFLVSSFPNSADYLNFFKNLTNYAKDKGIVVFIKSAITPNNPAYGAVDPVVNAFMQGKTQTEYLNEKLQMLQTIIDEIEPDYLTMENEPGTMEASSGLSFGFSPDQVKAYLTYYSNNISNPNNIPLGAGAGTWENPIYFQKFSEVSGLDFVDIHIYSTVNGFFADKLVDACDLTKNSGKDVVFGECFLYKQQLSDLSTNLTAVEYAKRYLFDFWIESDKKFIEILSKYAQHYQSPLVTVFQPDRFFYYKSYQEGDENLVTNTLFAQVEQNVLSNIETNTFSPLMTEYLNLIDNACE